MNIEVITVGPGGRTCGQRDRGIECAKRYGHDGDHEGLTGNLELSKAVARWPQRRFPPVVTSG